MIAVFKLLSLLTKSGQAQISQSSEAVAAAVPVEAVDPALHQTACLLPVCQDRV